MPRNSVVLMLIVLLLASAAGGGTVYLRDGRQLTGKITRKDGKVKIEMALGTVVVNESDIVFASEAGPDNRPQGKPTEPPRREGAGVSIQPRTQWNISLVTLPEPVLFMTARKLELLGDLSETESIRHELGQWRILAHDGKRKVAAEWLSRERQRQRRDLFLELAKESAQLARKANFIRANSPAENARKKQLQAKAEAVMTKAAGVWPDLLIRDFFIATLDLQAGRFTQAEGRFRKCIEREPLVAAFHQGRGLALAGMKRHLAALAEFVACLELRDDTYETITLVQAAMKEVPGERIDEPICLKAKQLVARYEPPQRRRSGRARGITWLMPGKLWQSRGPELFTPPYDRLIAKQSLAVPINEGGALLVDADAVAGAVVMYVQLGDGQMIRAEPVRTTSRRQGTQMDLPLAVIRTRGASFTPVALKSPPSLEAGQTVTIRAANLYRQMGTATRAGQAKVLSVNGDAVRLDATLLPGEATGVILAG